MVTLDDLKKTIETLAPGRMEGFAMTCWPIYFLQESQTSMRAKLVTSSRSRSAVEFENKPNQETIWFVKDA